MAKLKSSEKETKVKKLIELWIKGHAAQGGILTDKVLKEELRKHVDSLNLSIISFNRLHKYLKDEFNEQIYFSEKSKNKNVLAIIEKLQGKKGAKLEDISRIAQEFAGLNNNKVVEQISQLQREGQIFSPRRGLFKLVGDN